MVVVDAPDGGTSAVGGTRDADTVAVKNKVGETILVTVAGGALVGDLPGVVLGEAEIGGIGTSVLLAGRFSARVVVSSTVGLAGMGAGNNATRNRSV